MVVHEITEKPVGWAETEIEQNKQTEPGLVTSPLVMLQPRSNNYFVGQSVVKWTEKFCGMHCIEYFTQQVN